jgi:hypothetical protein
MQPCAVFALLFVSSAFGLAAQRSVIREVKHDVSLPLRSLAFPSVTVITADEREELWEAPERGAPVVAQADAVVQETAGTKLKTTPGINLLGLGSGFIGPQGTFQIGGAPPDPNASVGATQIVETVNLQLAVFDKATGAPTLGPTFLGSLWSGFNASCSTAADIADPVVVYDKQAGRWLVNIHTLGNPYVICFAVSTSGDATGTYNRYAFQVQALGSATNEQLGVWPDGYYLAQWISTSKSTYVGPQACAADRQQMLAGQTATMQCFQIDNTSLHGMAPSDLDGTNPPPAGSPNYYLIQGPAGSNSLYLYRFHVDFTTPANSTFTGPTTIDVGAYKPAPAFGVAAIPQPGTSQLLDVNGNDMMPRLAYRYFADANPPYESLVATHSVTAGTGSSSRTAVRWYELRNPGTSVTVYQQGTYSPDTTHRWMGSIAMDKMGDIAVGYSVSSASVYPGMRYTGRVSSDPLNALEAEATVYSGSGSQSSGARWGDYTSMSVDPADDCTMWYTGEYMAGSGALEWATRVFSFRFSACK